MKINKWDMVIVTGLAIGYCSYQHEFIAPKEKEVSKGDNIIINDETFIIEEIYLQNGYVKIWFQWPDVAIEIDESEINFY